jgi:hypothetical protein
MKRFLMLSFFSFGVLFAQNLPNCSQALTFTGVHAGAAISSTAGASQGCAGWRLTWQVAGSISAATIQLEGSQNNSTWAAFSGALVIEGSNPTSWTSATVSNTIVVRASLPYVRVNVTGVTGTGSIKTLVLGYSGTSAQWDAGGGGGGTPGGADRSIQFNNGGVFGGAIGSQVDPSNGALFITPTDSPVINSDVYIGGDSHGNTALAVIAGPPGDEGPGQALLISGESDFYGIIKSGGNTQSNLGTLLPGYMSWCSDCTVVTCAASGSGAWVFGTASGNVCPF